MLFKQHLTLKNILFAIITILFLYFLAQIKEVALLFFGSYVIACSLNPIVNKLSKKMPRIWATTIVMSISLALILAVFLPIFSVTLKEFKALVLDIPNFVTSTHEFLSQFNILGHSIHDFVKLDNLSSILKDVGKSVVNHSVDVTMGFVSVIAVVFSLVMIVFYLIYEEDEIKKGFLKLFPPKIRPTAEKLTDTISERVGGYIIAQLASMLVVGVIVALGLSLLQVKYAMFLGLLAAVTDIIPIIGPTIAVAFGAIAAIPNGLIIIILTIFVFLLAQWISNNFARPLVFGKFLNLHPLIIIISFLIGAQFLGVWGVILAPALAAVIVTLFDEIYVKLINKEFDEE